MPRRCVVVAAVSALALGAPATAEAFCGFYINGAGAEMFNNATQVVLMRHGTTTVLSMQNNYQGPPESFALVVPVPVVLREADVKTLPRELFGKVDVLGAPRLVEYWEQDPCPPPVDEYEYLAEPSDDDEGEEESESPAADVDYQEYKVTVEAEFTVAEYDIVVLSAKESTGLERWLRDNRYQIPDDIEPLLRPYIETGSKFFVARVDAKKVKFAGGMATLSPLRFQYDSEDFALPIRLGLANSSGTQDLIVNILSPGGRFEVANRPNVTIPTNLPVKDQVRHRFAEFYAALFDHTLELAPGAVVTEYAWDSASCDPCPGPTLDGNDLASLGADVLAATYSGDFTYTMTLTRLHARYGAEIDDDLVFRAVDGLVGGVGMPDGNGKLDTSVHPGEYGSAFQGRYVILHPWTGAIACSSPMRGRWGGPPAQQVVAPLQAATDLAFAPRGGVGVDELVDGEVPEVAVLSSRDRMVVGEERLPGRGTGSIRGARGCGCAGAGGSSGAALLALAVVIALRRRRCHLP